MPAPTSRPAPKRHLTVLNNTDGAEGGDAPRRPWQWVGFGALAIFTAWIPLAGIAAALAARFASGRDGVSVAGVLVLAMYMAALVLGAVLGGYLVGRWGTTGVGVREAAFSGLGASVVAGAVTWVSFGPSPGAFLLAALATPAAALGGRAGLRARRP